MLSLGDIDFWVPEKRIFAFELSLTTVVRQFVQGSFQLHKTEISDFILTGSLGGYSIAIRLINSSLASNRIQPDEFCEKSIFSQNFTSSEQSFVENLLRLQDQKNLDILIGFGEKPFKCLKIQKIKDERELDSIL